MPHLLVQDKLVLVVKIRYQIIIFPLLIPCSKALIIAALLSIFCKTPDIREVTDSSHDIPDGDASQTHILTVGM